MRDGAGGDRLEVVAALQDGHDTSRTHLGRFGRRHYELVVKHDGGQTKKTTSTKQQHQQRRRRRRRGGGGGINRKWTKWILHDRERGMLPSHGMD